MPPRPGTSDADLAPAVRAVRRMQTDLALANNLLFGDKLWEKQQEILHSVTHSRRTAVRSCHGAGKSFAAARCAASFLLTHPGCIVVTTAPTDRQVKKIMWQEIRKARGKIRVPCRSAPIIQEWQVEDGWFGIGLSTNDPDSFQGLHSSSGDILVVIDEACGVEQRIWDAVDGSLSSKGARLLSIGNPTDRTGSFFKEFESATVNKIRISAFDTPNFTAFGITREDIADGSWEAKIGDADLPYPSLVTPEWVAEKYRRWGPRSLLYMARVEGEFPEDDADQLIQLTWIDKAKQRYLEYTEASEDEKRKVSLKPVELGLDVARWGRNETSLAIKTGIIVGMHSSWRGKDTMYTTGLVVRALNDTGAEVVKVDDGGVGGGVTDRLNELGKPVEPVNAGSAPTDKENFANRRAELWWRGREALQNNVVMLIPDDVLESQLVKAPRYAVDSKGRIKVESKEEMELRGIESPDRADAWLLALAPKSFEPVPIVHPMFVERESPWPR